MTDKDIAENKREKHPLVSIITPCLNGEAYLPRYFESILRQTYRPLELIFVNDGSTDETDRVAASYAEKLEQSGISFTYLEQEKNKGQAAALNRGLKLFKGEYLTWPDADDVMLPECIEKKVAFLQHHPDVQMVCCNGMYYDPELKKETPIIKNSKPEISNVFEDLLMVHNIVHPTSYLITKELLEESYPDRDIYESRTGQNWQILLPCASRSLCGYIDEILMTVYVHSDSHSRQIKTTIQQYKRWEDFAEVEHHAIDASACDKAKYHREVDANRYRQEFYYAIDMNDKEKIRRCFKGMKDNGSCISFEDRMLFFRHMLRMPRH